MISSEEVAISLIVRSKLPIATTLLGLFDGAAMQEIISFFKIFLLL